MKNIKTNMKKNIKTNMKKNTKTNMKTKVDGRADDVEHDVQLLKCT